MKTSYASLANSLPDRLPTVSASQALQTLNSSQHQAISTGLRQLDELLQSRESAPGSQHALRGGLPRGQVTEIYGPPGVRMSPSTSPSAMSDSPYRLGKLRWRA